MAMVGNRKLRVLPTELVEFLQLLPPTTTILLRSGNLSKPGWFEHVVARACAETWLTYRWIRPDPDGDAGATFDRDVTMVRQSDAVMAFFVGEEMIGGTAHVVEKAIDQGVPAYAYGVREGRFVRIGEHDPDALWAEFAPKL